MMFKGTGGGGNGTDTGNSRSIGRPDTRKAEIFAIRTNEDMSEGMNTGTTDGMTGRTSGKATDGMTEEVAAGRMFF
jgi:hypothetical protein